MLAVVIAEGVAIVLLGVLVLGLLRSHALILKALHELGAGLELEKEAGTGVSHGDHRWQARTRAGRARVGRGAGDPQGLGHGPRHRRHRPRPGRAAGHRHDARHPHAAGLPHQRLQRLPDLLGRVPGAGRRSRRRDAARSSPRAPPRSRSRACARWPATATWSSRPRPGSTTTSPGSPYFVYVEGGVVTGEGSATTWAQVRDLMAQGVADSDEARAAAGRTGPGPARR